MATPDDLWGPMVQVESSGDPNAVGDAGEIGLVQIKPSTAAQYGVPKEALYHPEVQRMLFNKIMGSYLQRYNGNATQAVGAWNAGPGAVDRGYIPQGYIRRVINAIQQFAGATPAYAEEAPDIGGGVAALGQAQEALQPGFEAPEALAGEGQPPEPPPAEGQSAYDNLFRVIATGRTQPATQQQAMEAERGVPEYTSPQGRAGVSYGPVGPPWPSIKEQKREIRAQHADISPLPFVTNVAMRKIYEGVQDQTADSLEKSMVEGLTAVGFPERDAEQFAEGFVRPYRTPGVGLFLLWRKPDALAMITRSLVKQIAETGEAPEAATVLDTYAKRRLAVDAPRWQLALRNFMQKRFPDVDWAPLVESAEKEMKRAADEMESLGFGSEHLTGPPNE